MKILEQAKVSLDLALKALVVLVLVGFTPSTGSDHQTTLPLPLHPFQSSNAQSITDAEMLADIFITDQGFSPPIFSISVGDTIRWMNQTGEAVRIESTGSSTQTIFLPLIFKTTEEGQTNATVSGDLPASSNNLTRQDTTWQSGDIPPGGTFSRTFNQPGQYTYSLTNAPSQTAAFIVQPTDSGNLSVAFDESGSGLSLAEAGVGLTTLGNDSRMLSIDIGGPVEKAFLYWAGRDTPCPNSGGICFIPSEPYKDQVLKFDNNLITGEIIGTDPRGSTNNIGYRADVTDIVQAKNIDDLSFEIEDGDTTSNLNTLDGAGLLVIYTDPHDSSNYKVTVFEGLDYAFRTATTKPVVFNHGAASDDRTAQLLIFVGDAEAERPDLIDITDDFGRTTPVINELASADGEQWDTLSVDITIPAGGDSTTVQVISEPIKQNPDSLLWEVAALRVSAALNLIVNNTSDSGPGSLRQAILNANTKPGPDIIEFDIPGDGPHTISPITPLPTVTDPTLIDGVTQPGASCKPQNLLIIIDGGTAGVDVDGLSISTGNSTVRGLIIQRFDGDGIELSTNGNSLVECNILSLNNRNGINVSSGISNTLTVNSIFDNGQLGIDLGGDGPTANDIGDPDTGANSLQNFPVITRAYPDNSSTKIEGRLNSIGNTIFSLDFFVNETCGPSNFGEGKIFLGTISVTTDINGDVNFTQSFSLAIPDGQFVTATATDPNGNTSEFSRCASVGPNNDSWPTALRLVPGSLSSPTSFEQFLDMAGQSRWYKFAVEPNSQVIVSLTDLPEDYDLTVYKDIAAAFEDLQKPDSLQDLLQLGAEFAPGSFSPGSFSPGSFSPGSFSPGSFSPDVFAPGSFSPGSFSPGSFSPGSFSPDVFAPGSFSPGSFSPGSFSPDSFSPGSFSPDVFAPGSFSPGSFSPGSFSPGSFSPGSFSSAQTRSLIGVSAFEGTASEGLLLNTWNNTGDFYIRVRGRNGTFSVAAPFQVNVILEPGSCDGISPLPSSDSILPPGNHKTIILTDLSRNRSTDPTGRPFLDGTDADKDILESRLADLANRTEVDGVVVDVSQDPRVVFANNQADTNPICPYAKNLVAQAIKDIVDNYRASNPDLEYIVFVGGDDLIPFFRYPDLALLGNETNYIPPVLDNTASQASLRLGYVLTQDTYGASRTLSLDTNNFPIPELALGRLVESAPEIINMIDAYLLTTDGTVESPDSSLVTGYDFLEDAAIEVASELEAGLGTGPDTLISARDLAPELGWTADDLGALFLNNRYDLAFLAGHFSANSALAADFGTNLLTTDIAASSVDMTNAIIYSAGCHSGYNIVSNHGIPGVTFEPDWAQVFAQKGATLIAGTGYQYGDTDFIEYSERIYLELTRQLRTGSGSVAIGKALVTAKQNYLAGTPLLRGIHEKSLLEATLFGLPMLSVNMPGERITPASDASIVTPPLATFSADPGATLGLEFADVSITPQLALRAIDLRSEEDGSDVTANWLAGSDGIVSNPTEPILPLELENVTVSGTVLRGVGFRGGSFTDQNNILPLTGAATTEIRGVHTPFFTSVFYPVQPWSVNYFDALTNSTSGATNLILTPAQFLSDNSNPQIGTLRQFNNMDFRLYYSNNIDTFAGDSIPALSGAPTIIDVLATFENEELIFKVNVVGNPAAGIQEVWVTYTAINGLLAGSWQSLDLAQNITDSTLWEASLNLTGTDPQDIRFIVQAVNGVGLVTLDTNLGAYFVPVSPNAIPKQGTSLSLESSSSLGVYGAQTTFNAVLETNGTTLPNQLVVFTLGSQTRLAITNGSGQASVSIPLLSLPGDYEIRATFLGTLDFEASSNTDTFTIVKADTELTLDPQPAIGFADDDALMTATLASKQTQQPLVDERKTVFFVITGNSSDVVPVVTDPTGRAILGNVDLPPGQYTVTAYFNGTIPISTGRTVTLDDARYNPSLAVGSLTLAPTEVGPIDLLRFCGFAFNSGQGLRVDQQATIACDVGSNGRVDFVNQAVIIGDVVSIEDTVHLDQEVRVEGNVAAGGDVQLKKDAVVSGDVTAAGPVFVEVGAVVSGTISQNTGVPPSSVITSPSLSLIAGTQDIIVEKSNSPFTLAPGSYGKLEVRTEATLNLSAGVYAFEEIRLDRQAIVNLDVSAGTILIDVVKGVSTSEEVQMLSNGSAENILFRVQGDQVTLHLNGVYLGTFLAPNGTINLEQGATLTGALYGQNVNVKHRARLIGAPAVALLFNGLSGRP